MLIITLVENALKHGVEAVGGGSVWVRACREGDIVRVAVLDDGAGLGGAASCGTGVGLANVRRQLAARYKGAASFTLESRTPRGTRATISIPLRIAATVPEHERYEQAA
jgi:LytS/YehU family sensor histidine kinase